MTADGVLSCHHSWCDDILCHRRTGDNQSSADPIHRVRQYVASSESDDTRNPTERRDTAHAAFTSIRRACFHEGFCQPCILVLLLCLVLCMSCLWADDQRPHCAVCTWCRFPSMKEAAGRQSAHLHGTEGEDDKAYSQLAPESGPHQDKSRPPPGPHDVSG